MQAARAATRFLNLFDRYSGMVNLCPRLGFCQRHQVFHVDQHGKFVMLVICQVTGFFFDHKAFEALICLFGSLELENVLRVDIGDELRDLMIRTRLLYGALSLFRVIEIWLIV